MRMLGVQSSVTAALTILLKIHTPEFIFAILYLPVGYCSLVLICISALALAVVGWCSQLGQDSTPGPWLRSLYTISIL